MKQIERVAYLVSLIGISAIALSACASYNPYEGSDAALLRTSQQGVMASYPFLRPIGSDGKCGPSIGLPSLVPAPLSAPQASGPALTTSTQQGPRIALRAGMLGSPKPEATEISEQRLAPGRYSIRMGGMLPSTTPGVIGYQCLVDIAFDFKASEHFWVGFSGAGRTYGLRVLRVQLVDGVQTGAPHNEPIAKFDGSQCK